jgi:uncharacterized protein (DUF2267 family)
VKYDEFMRSVSSATGLTKARADEAVVATLATLAEHISSDETRDLLAQLPKSLKTRVEIPAQPSPIGVDEFMRRAAERLGDVEVDEAAGYVRAVFATLVEAVNSGEMRDIANELGVEFSSLLGRPAQNGSPSVLSTVTGLARRASRVVTAMPRAAFARAGAGVDAGLHATRKLTDVVTRRALPAKR